VDTSSGDITVTIPDPASTAPPIQVDLGGDGYGITIPSEPPFAIPTGDEVRIEFPTSGTITIPRHPPTSGRPHITVKGGRRVPPKPPRGTPRRDI
jgi:hypothetical protein